VPTKPVTRSPSALAALERLDGKLFATTTETAAVFRYNYRTVMKAIEDGDIPAVRYGSTWRIPTAWIREQASIGTASGPERTATAAELADESARVRRARYPVTSGRTA